MRKLGAVAFGVFTGLTLFCGMSVVWMKWSADPSKDALISF